MRVSTAESFFPQVRPDAIRDVAKRMLRRIPTSKRAAPLRPLWANERDSIRRRLIAIGVPFKDAELFACAEGRYRQHFADLHGDEVLLGAPMILWNDSAGWINFALRWRIPLH